MKKSERIISALVTMALGILFIVLKDSFIGILMTVAGVSLIVLGVVDIVHRDFPQAIVKIVSGILLIVAGWVIVEAVLYILAAILLIFSALFLYDKIKNRTRCHSIWQTILEYATPCLCIVIGVLLLFHNSEFIQIVCVLSGILTVIEGGVLLLQAFSQE